VSSDEAGADSWIAPFVERCGRILVARNAHFNEVDDLLAQCW